MKTKQQKTQDLESLQKRIPDSKITVFTSFAKEGEKGLTVSQMTELRKSLREKGGEYLVSKKTLIKKAVDSDLVNPREFEGSVGVVLGFEDPIETAKSVYEFSKKTEALVVHGAIFENGFLDAGQFTELAKLPGREVLLARAIGMMNYPLTGLATVLQANIRNLLLVLKNIKK